jgi:hypothetical protein
VTQVITKAGTALFTITKLWKQPRCPTTDEWIEDLKKKTTEVSIQIIYPFFYWITCLLLRFLSSSYSLAIDLFSGEYRSHVNTLILQS